MGSSEPATAPPRSTACVPAASPRTSGPSQLPIEAPRHPWARVLAWSAHLYTALGLILAAGIAVQVVRGTPDDFRGAFLLMLAATVVDATDGTLARAARVKQVLPHFDGRRLDDIIDYMTYTALPLLLVWRAELLPGSFAWCLLAPLVASAYGFCQCDAKTDDGYFLGFPSYWNVVALYLYVLTPPPWLSLALLLALAALTFAPMRCLYPSQPGGLNRLALVLGVVWGAGLLWTLARLDVTSASTAGSIHDPVRRGMLASLAYPALYTVGSFTVTFQVWRRSKGQTQQ
jgi:phosphatidylcholine synthase